MISEMEKLVKEATETKDKYTLFYHPEFKIYTIYQGNSGIFITNVRAEYVRVVLDILNSHD